MKTNPIYLTETYQKNTIAKVLDVIKADGKESLVLDQTVCYPMGGGQPTDQAQITQVNGEAKSIEIYEVLIKEGEINHYVKNSGLKPGDVINIELNWDRRYKNMQVHSAGHLIDFALISLGYVPQKLKPLKGNHGKKASIEYSGVIENITEFEAQLISKINELRAKNLNFNWEFVDHSVLETEAIYLQPGLPTNKPLRSLTLETVGTVADGGTIVKSTSEIPDLEVKVEVNESNIVVNYGLKVENKEQKIEDRNDQAELSLENQEYLDRVSSEIILAKSEDELTNLWRKYLGKDGSVKELLKNIKNIPAEERKDYGQQINELSNQVDELINNAKADLKNSNAGEYLSKKLINLDHKKAKIGHLHPLTETINEINSIFKRLGYSVYDGPEIETYEFNFERCNVPADHPALDLQDSIYIEEPNILLRTQTSSIEARALQDLKPPFKIVMPGRTYRNEKVNRSNHFTFHQYQLVCVQEKVSMAELISTIEYLFKNFLGDVLGEDKIKTRYRNKYYPEVEPGVGPDLQCWMCDGKGCGFCKHRGWVEMGGSGIIHPNIMRMAGLDTNKWQGYAFGLGLDRWAMAKHGIEDIRTLLGGNLAYKPNVR